MRDEHHEYQNVRHVNLNAENVSYQSGMGIKALIPSR